MTEADENPGQKALQDQFAARVFENYKNRSQEFNKTFSLLLAFAVIFMLLIQVPYTLIKIKQAATDRRLEDIARQTRQLDQKTRLYSGVLQGVDSLHDAMRSGPENLRSEILRLSALRNRLQNQGEVEQNQMRQQQQPQQQQGGFTASGACGDPRRDQWLNCEVAAAVSTQFEAFQVTLNRDILQPLQKLAETGEGIDTQRVQTGLAALQKAFWHTLQENRQFWLTFSGKVDFFSQLDGQVDRFWSTHGADIEKKARRLKKELGTLKDEHTRLQKDKNNLLTTATAIEKRISSIESPFGKLPVGMAEAIALCPLIIAFGFAIAAIKLISAIKLRREIFKSWRSQDPQKNLLSDEQINLIAPLSFAPSPGGKLPFGKVSLLFLPFVIYVLACLLILYTWTWGVAQKEEALMSGLKPVYGMLYITTVILMAVSYWNVLQTMRRLSNQDDP